MNNHFTYFSNDHKFTVLSCEPDTKLTDDGD